MNAGMLVASRTHHQPWTETQHQQGEGDQGDDILDDQKSVVDQFHRFVAALAPGILQPVVKIRIFEISQIQSQRFADDLGANAIGELELNQLLNQPAAVIEGRAEQEKNQLEDQINKNFSDLLGVLAALDRCDHAVDDELSDPGLARRQERATQVSASPIRQSPNDWCARQSERLAACE